VNSIVLLKSLVQKDRRLILNRLSEEVDEIASEWTHKVETLAEQFDEISSALSSKIRELKTVKGMQKIDLEKEVKALKSNLNTTWDEWIQLTRIAAKKFELAH